MKKKKMLHSCIASFLTGSVSIIVQAHGVVGLSDSPVASTIRPSASNDQPSDELLDQSINVERERPLIQDSSEERCLQESIQSSNTCESLGQHPPQNEPAVRIIRSGYIPHRERPLSYEQQESVAVPSEEQMPEPASHERHHQRTESNTSNIQGSQSVQNIPMSSNTSSTSQILGDEMVVVEQLPTSHTQVSDRVVVDKSELVVRQPNSDNILMNHFQQAVVSLGSVQPDDISALPNSNQSPSSVSVVAPQPLTAEEQNERLFPAQGPFNFDFQRYEPIVGVGTGSSTDELNQLITMPVEAFSAPSNGKDMSIHETVQRAIAWHPSIAEALGRLYQQGEQVNVAKSGYFPQVRAGISTEHRSSTGRSEDAFTVSASQLLYDFGRISSEVDAAKYGVDRDQARVWLAMDQLAKDTAQAAIEIQRFKALLDIAQEQIEGINDIRELAERRSALGASTRSDEIQAQSRLESAEATELQLQAQLKTWDNTVRTLIGANGPVSIKRDFPQQLTQSCELASEDFDNVPELMVAEAQQAEAKAIIEQAQASFFPTASLEAGFNQFLNNNLVEDDNDVTVRVNLTSNLYQGGATSARRRAADFSLQATEAARDSALLSLSRSLREAKEQTASLGLRLEALDARALSIRETQDLYRQQYLSLGTRSLLDLLNTEQEIHQSRFDQENTRYDLYSLQIDCLYSTADIREAFNLEDAIVQGSSVLP
ncbi:TolC family outer membrane protein [Vreelandella venusta]